MGTKTRAVASEASTRCFVSFTRRECRKGGEVTGVGSAVVVLEVVDLRVIPGQAAACPRPAGRIGGAARAGQGGRDVAGQMPDGSGAGVRLRAFAGLVGVRHDRWPPSGGRRRRGPRAA